MENPKRIAVVGTGYVGLVAAACFAEWGHQVICADIDSNRIELLRNGGIPIYEPGLHELVARNVNRGLMSFTTDTGLAVAGSDAVFIAVGTPSRETNGEADLSFVFESAMEIARAIAPGAIIVTKSTVPVGTGDSIERLVRKQRPGMPVPIVSNPEFLREGTAISDFQTPDRVVIGTEDESAEAIMRAIYAPVIHDGRPFVVTKRRSAELIKYAANAFLATKIAFINEVADLCEAVDANVGDIARGIGLDQRIGPHFLQAGPGFGGSCFPKDTLALVRTAQENGVALRIVEETVMANSTSKRRMALKVRNILGGNVQGKRIAVLGLTFKADTDDMRESPAIPLVEQLQRSGAEIHAYDPQGTSHAKAIFSGIAFHDDPYDCATGADAIVCMTDWDVLKFLDLSRLAAIMRKPVMVDLRRMFSVDEAVKQGFAIETIGQSGTEPLWTDPLDPPCLVPDLDPRERINPNHKLPHRPVPGLHLVRAG